MKFKINFRKVIPVKKDIEGVIKLIISALISYYVLTAPFNKFFPTVESYPLVIKISIFTALIYYLHNLFELNIFNQEIL